MRHTLQCVCQQIYKQIVVRTIDADVLILPISHLGSFTSHDTSAVNVYAEMVNSSIFYDMKKSLHFSNQTYGKHCLSSMHLLDAISFLASTRKESMKRGICGWAVNTKILTPIYFQD